MDDLTYPDAGMTAGEGAATAGFHALRLRERLVDCDYEAAVAALFAWRMHRAVPLLAVSAEAAEAAPGVRVVLSVGPLRAPCRVVWTVREENRAGFAYGTLPGHPECGEEAFLLERRPGGSVDVTVHALSRPAAWYLRAAGPLGRAAQRTVARRYIAALRRLSRNR